MKFPEFNIKWSKSGMWDLRVFADIRVFYFPIPRVFFGLRFFPVSAAFFFHPTSIINQHSHRNWFVSSGLLMFLVETLRMYIFKGPWVWGLRHRLATDSFFFPWPTHMPAIGPRWLFRDNKKRFFARPQLKFDLKTNIPATGKCTLEPRYYSAIISIGILKAGQRRKIMGWGDRKENKGGGEGFGGFWSGVYLRDT